MTVAVRVRDAFDDPVAGELVSVQVGHGGQGCLCCPPTQAKVTNVFGVVHFEVKKVGGRGQMIACARAVTSGNIDLGCRQAAYTSPDLNGDCETDVLDIALWANCLPPSPSCTVSDYDCDGTVGVIDLGIFAGGLNVNCSDGPPCP